MTESSLKIFLLAFAISVLWLIFFWDSFRRLVSIEKKTDQDKIYKRIKRLHPVYVFVTVIFLAMMVSYSFFPEIYSLFIPIERLDRPVINGIGLLVLKFSFVWLIISELKLDRRIRIYSEDVENLTLMIKVHIVEDNIIKGLLIMFIGIFITISNIAGILFCLLSIVFYLYSKRTFRKHQ